MLAVMARSAARVRTGSAMMMPMIIAVSRAARQAHPAAPARVAGRYRVLRAATVSSTMTTASTRPGTMPAVTGTGQVHARPVTSPTAQQQPTTGPIRSSRRAVWRAGCTR